MGSFFNKSSTLTRFFIIFLPWISNLRIVSYIIPLTSKHSTDDLWKNGGVGEIWDNKRLNLNQRGFHAFHAFQIATGTRTGDLPLVFEKAAKLLRNVPRD